MKFFSRNLETNPKYVVFELGGSGSLKRDHTNTLFDKSDKSMVLI